MFVQFLLAAATLVVRVAAIRELHNEPDFLEVFGRKLGDTVPSNPPPPEDVSYPIVADRYGGAPGFYHSVASGDPTEDSVIIWTRYTPVSADEVVTLEFRMAEVDPDIEFEAHLDPYKNKDLKRGLVTVTAETDFVAKLDITGLKSYTQYVFAFLNGDVVSRVGKTKTAPSKKDDVEKMVYATFACSHFANGYFHAYDVASTIKDLDMFIHTGDYLYEYGLFDTYASDSPERKETLLPVWEQVSLQDHRNRHSTYLADEGLMNLRQAAPMVATWDDHETTNNPYGQGTPETTGAQNHQEFCPVGPDATLDEKNAVHCDRDEGDIVPRLNAAFQAYMEYLPLRHMPGNMGVIDLGNFAQTVQWGDLATFVSFETRVSYRSREPTLNANTLSSSILIDFADEYPDASEYTDPSTEAYAALKEVAKSLNDTLWDPQFTMIGDNIHILEDVLVESAEEGTTWQIWAANTAIGPAVKPNWITLHELVEDPEAAATVKALTDGLVSSSNFFRRYAAATIELIPWNRDGHPGFGHETSMIMDIMQKTNNPIILSGDLHDSYGWTLYEKNLPGGTPAAVNLVAQGVTAPGWGPFLIGTFASLADTLGSLDDVYKLIQLGDETANPGMQYYDMQYKGFYAVSMTKESHTAEYFAITPENILTDYETARASSGLLTSDFFCRTSLKTTAGMPGSLDRSDDCSAISFQSTSKPAVYSLPVPPASTDGLMMYGDCGYIQCEVEAKELKGKKGGKKDGKKDAKKDGKKDGKKGGKKGGKKDEKEDGKRALRGN